MADVELLSGNETDPAELNLNLGYSENHTFRDIEGSILNPEHEKEMGDFKK